MKTLAIVASVWFVLLCCLFVFSAPLAEALWVGYALIYWGSVLAGSVILLVAVVRVRRSPKAAGFAMIATLAGLTLFFSIGFRLGRIVLFQLRRPRYETLLDEAIRANEVPRGMGMIDDGPPIRYAFYWQRGVIDNWVGVVYDPTGEVVRVNEIPDMTALHDGRWQDMVSLFGGDMYRCEHIQGAWYICWFT